MAYDLYDYSERPFFISGKLGVKVTILIVYLTICSYSFAFGAKSETALSPFGFHPAGIYQTDYPNRGFTDALNIGVKWHRESFYAKWYVVQPDLGEDVYDFSQNDYYFALIPEEIQILANITLYSTINPQYALEGSYLPIDEEKYIDFVKAVVERYDGDGFQDMPGLENPIHYWQVYNEPNEQKRSDFAELQRITYQAIKNSDPEAFVMAGGFGSGPYNFIGAFELGYEPIIEQLAGNYADAFAIHWTGTATGDYRMCDKKTGADVIGYIRGVLSENGFPQDTQIWVTEMSAYSGDPEGNFAPYQSEREQAADYFKRIIFAIARGVSKIFPAFGLMEGFKPYRDGEVYEGYYEHTGIIYNGLGLGDPGVGVKKLSYYSYKKMTELLEGSDWGTLTVVRDGTNSDHIYLLRVKRESDSIYIGWWDYFDDPDYSDGNTRLLSLSGFPPGVFTVYSVVPSADTGQEVLNYDGAFATTQYVVSNGSADVVLGVNPVIIRFNEDPSVPITVAYVDQEEGNPCSGKSPCFSKIQDAINANSDDGSVYTVYITQGDYIDPIVINKPKSITLNGDGTKTSQYKMNKAL